MSNDRGNTMLAFLLGGIIGAGIALLYAPDSGYETRRRIREGYDDAEDWAKDKYSGAKDRIEDGTGRVKDILGDRKEDLRSAIDAGKDAYSKGKKKFLKESV
jgi:gas vesicle protein